MGQIGYCFLTLRCFGAHEGSQEAFSRGLEQKNTFDKMPPKKQEILHQQLRCLFFCFCVMNSMKSEQELSTAAPVVPVNS